MGAAELFKLGVSRYGCCRTI